MVYDTITCGLQSCSCEQMFYSRSSTGSGVAVLTAGPAKIRSFGFCADDVIDATLPYNSGDNVQT